MKTLYLIRHAKAEDHGLLKNDYNRNIISKGKERAIRIANELATQLKINNNTLVISSSANRAKQTADIFCEILGYPLTDILETREIYEAHFTDILRIINNVPNNVENLLVFGHNPGLSNLTNYLSHAEVELATSNAAILSLPDNFNFSELAGGTATLLNTIQ
ncbi:SixA phosphatase family protein [Sphingobacterium sp.]|uniref:SixA phosphatase family protein n=1 Tax=Sphingobacterium sp. TaxID=341027 RepID=UPI00289A6E9F|nr:histidine phosphatase family protein [Sphingobacterium sp.]